MGTMNISLNDSLQRFVDHQVRDGGYSGTSEYVRELIRKDRDIAKLRALLEEGVASPIEGNFDAAYFKDLRKRIRTRRASRRKA